MPVLIAQCAAAIFSGVILQFISPPLNWHFLHWASYLPLFFALSENSNRKNFFLGWLCGFSGVFFLFFWLIDTFKIFAHWPSLLGCIVYIIFCAVFALPYAMIAALFGPLRRSFPKSWIYFFASSWVAVEYLTPALFPYYQGLSQYRVPMLWQAVSVFGISGMSFLVILSNACLFDMGWRLKCRQKMVTLMNAAVAVIFLVVMAFGFWRVRDLEQDLAKAPALRVGLVQVKEPLQIRTDQTQEWNLKLFVEQSHRINSLPLDLLVWPEGLLLRTTQDVNVEKPISEIMNGQFSLLTGAKTQMRRKKDGVTVYYNSAVLFDKGGSLSADYHKMVLVPFGEYLPPWLAFLNPVWGGEHIMQAGQQPTVFHLENMTFTTPICYEAILKKQMLRLAGGDIIINITEDGWFGDTAAPYQHAMLAATSATELGRPLIRSAVNGVNMVVEPDGRFIYETKPFQDRADVVSVPLVFRKTFYLLGGRYFPILSILITALALAKMLNSKRVNFRTENECYSVPASGETINGAALSSVAETKPS